MKKELGCPFTIREYNRLTKNLEIYNKINDKQKEWLEAFMDENNYELKKVVLQLIDGILWIVINTRNSVKQFE
jgi:hypothetical protein